MSLVVPSEQLDPVADDAGTTVSALPELPPQFFIPHLEDKPQNPIMDTLRIMQGITSFKPAVRPVHDLPLELRLLSEDLAQYEQVKRVQSESVWEQAVSQNRSYVNQVLTWDALRPSFRTTATYSPFLSEQSTDTFASARYHIRPPIQNPDVQVIYVQVPDLFDSLLLTVSGTSSHLHIWNHELQKFVLRNLQGRLSGHIVIVGKDEVVSASLLKRFLTIGNLIRRLELLIEDRSASRKQNPRNPILHAFTHALASVLGFLRQMAETIPPGLLAIPGADARLTALWTRYEDMQLILLALATLCGREEHVDPADFEALPDKPTDLLSTIYNHLADHIECSSPRVVRAMLAYLLTNTSRGYISSLCDSVGYNTLTSKSQSSLSKSRSNLEDTDRLDAGAMDAANDDEAERELEVGADQYPEFIVPEVAEVFSRARKSLVLLRAADPAHPLLTSNHLHPEIEWLWTEEQLDNAEDAMTYVGPVPSSSQYVAAEREDAAVPATSSDVMNAFKIFDMLPGESSAATTALWGDNATNLLTGSYSTVTLREFLSTFPPTLPPSNPTLAHLTSRVLAPLITHAQALSGALVAKFLSPTTHLHLQTHLVLLRGYLLITAHAFKARLQEALFSDAEDIAPPVVGSRTYAASEARERYARERQMLREQSGRSRSRSRMASGKSLESETTSTGENKKQKSRRAIGLSPALIIGDKWPPLGSDLNFLLRTVIVDSLDSNRRWYNIDSNEDDYDETLQAEKRMVEEAEWRLGFAIRDLPMGTGREKWLNPLAIEALDFLYMHYQPPHPLDVLITPAVLSKYHRMFSFNLRLMRVENVVRTMFRLTRRATEPLFPTLTPSNKLLLHFRFVAQSFIMALSSYVYDIAIGSNMDRFLSRLDAASSASGPSLSASTTSTHRQGGGDKMAVAFADVFSLGEHHSKMLDDILSSCLLRSGQKAVGDILRGCMELVLELGVLAGELNDGNLEEYEAAPMLDELWGKFRAKMTTFIKVLAALVEKEADASGLVLSDIPLHMMQGHRRISGTTANLHQLLLRLNMSDWWTKKDKPTRPL